MGLRLLVGIVCLWFRVGLVCRLLLPLPIVFAYSITNAFGSGAWFRLTLLCLLLLPLHIAIVDGIAIACGYSFMVSVYVLLHIAHCHCQLPVPIAFIGCIATGYGLWFMV